MKTSIYNLLILDESGVVMMSQKLTAPRARWFERVAEHDACANEGFFDV